MSCQWEYSDETPGTENTDLRVAQTRAFFETEMEQLSNAGRELPMGELTPHWEKAIASADEQTESVDVPITTRYAYMAVRQEWIDGKNRSYYAPITMRLVVLRNPETGVMKAYRQAIIPDYGYMRKNRGDLSAKFPSVGTKNDFSGTLFYMELDGSIPTKAFIYKDGELTSWLTLSADNQEDYLRQLNALVELYRDYNIGRRTNLAMRSLGGWEDPWDDSDHDGGGGNGYGTDIGNGFWITPGGNVYYDYDNNGTPDGPWTNLDPADAVGNRPAPPGWDDDFLAYNPPTSPTGGGGSGSGGGGSSSATPNAKRILRSSTLTDAQWQKLERMLERMLDDCMGWAVYDVTNQMLQQLREHYYSDYGVDQIGITFNSDPEWRRDGQFENDYGLRNPMITLASNVVSSDYLLHEMFHFVQKYNSNPVLHEMNIELEAFVAQYRYLLTLGDSNALYQFENSSIGPSIRDVNSFLDSNGQLHTGANVSNFQNAINACIDQLRKTETYKDKPYDSSVKGMDNFKNLTDLSGGC